MMVKGNSGLLSFTDSFGRSAKITKFETDAFANMQRTNSTQFAAAILDPNYVEPPQVTLEQVQENNEGKKSLGRSSIKSI